MIKSRELWATESNYLNDPSEVAYAANLVVAALNARIAVGLSPSQMAAASSAVTLLERVYSDPHTLEQYREDRAFITSFSRSDQSLTLWRTYAGQDGFAVGFTQDDLLHWVGRDEYPSSDPGDSSGRDAKEEYEALRANFALKGNFYDVSYGDSRITPIVDDVIALPAAPNQLLLEGSLRALFNRLPETKHSAYEDEREARLVLLEQGDFAPDPHVRVGGNGTLVAYQKLVFPFHALRTITIAPGANVGQTTRALHSLMRQGGRGPWSHVEIRVADIPFNW